MQTGAYSEHRNGSKSAEQPNLISGEYVINSRLASVCVSCPIRFGKCVWLYACPLHMEIWIGSHLPTNVSYFVLNLGSLAAAEVVNNMHANERSVTGTNCLIISGCLSELSIRVTVQSEFVYATVPNEHWWLLTK